MNAQASTQAPNDQHQRSYDDGLRYASALLMEWAERNPLAALQLLKAVGLCSGEFTATVTLDLGDRPVSVAELTDIPRDHPWLAGLLEDAAENYPGGPTLDTPSIDDAALHS